MFKFDVTCKECAHEFKVSIDNLECHSRGPSGDRATWYECKGIVKCPSCGAENKIKFLIDEADETGEILNYEKG